MRFLLTFLLCLSACTMTAGPCKTTADCPKSNACCDGRCTDVQNDKSNCGTCGEVCAFPNAAPSCRSGRCQFQCSNGFGNCNGDRGDGCEQPLTEDANNCGLCGRMCTAMNAAPVCSAALCGVGTCTTGFANCDTDSTNGCEVDTTTDVAHCGGCGQDCSLPHATVRCEASTCRVATCATDFGDCDSLAPNGCETSLPNDALHCGACGAKCGPAQICVNSRCRANELIVFGGTIDFSSSVTTNDVWKFDLTSKTFTALTPAMPDGNVPPRSQHIAVWDQPRNRMIIWGGVDGAGTPVPTDTWALDFAVVPPAWRKLTTSGTPPSERFASVAVLDPATSKVWLFGGTVEAGTGLSDLFTFDLATNTWAQVHASNAPNSPIDRINAMGALDAQHGLLVLFGGNNAGTRADVRELWQFELATRTWKTPPYLNGPVGRARGAFFSGTPVFLFSGIASLLNSPASMLTDFNALDATATSPWTVQSAMGPAARFNAAQGTRDGLHFVFAGGATGVGGQSTLSDLWQFDPATSQWTRLFDGTGSMPQGKLGATLVAR